MPKLYIMSGLPFSGKTSLAKKIADRLGATYVCFDELWVSHEPDLPNDKVAGWRYVRDLAKTRISEELRAGTSVVYDDTNVGVDHRQEIREVGQSLGAETIVVLAETPDEIRLERMQETLETRNRHDVEAEHLKDAVEQFQRPDASEGVVTYRPDEDLESWLGKLG